MYYNNYIYRAWSALYLTASMSRNICIKSGLPRIHHSSLYIFIDNIKLNNSIVRSIVSRNWMKGISLFSRIIWRIIWANPSFFEHAITLICESLRYFCYLIIITRDRENGSSRYMQYILLINTIVSQTHRTLVLREITSSGNYKRNLLIHDSIYIGIKYWVIVKNFLPFFYERKKKKKC